MVKQKQDSYYEEDSYEGDDFNEEEIEDSEDDLVSGDGEAVIEKPIMDGFFSYDLEIQNIDKTMRGFSPRNNQWVYTSKPLARDEFISGMINSFRSIIKQGSSLVSLTEDEINTILMEKNYEFAGSVYLEPTIDDDDAEKIINMHDHMLELFLKTLRDGLGNDTVVKMTGNFDYQNSKKPNDNVINWEAMGLKPR